MNDQFIAKQFSQPEGEAGNQIGIIMNQLNKNMNLDMIHQMKITKGDSILEIGFGNGAFIKEIFEHNSEIMYTGLEKSEKMVEVAKSINKDLIDKGKVDIVQGNSDNLPYSNEKFTKTMAVNLIYFWDSPLEDLKEIYRTLVTNGMLFISIRSQEKLKSDPISNYYFKLYNLAEIEELLSISGFSKTEAIHLYEPNTKQLDSICIIAHK